jgi:hypothetical protein
MWFLHKRGIHAYRREIFHYPKAEMREEWDTSTKQRDNTNTHLRREGGSPLKSPGPHCTHFMFDCFFLLPVEGGWMPTPFSQAKKNFPSPLGTYAFLQAKVCKNNNTPTKTFLRFWC